MPYLTDHPPASPQYRHPRRAKLSGVIVVHTAENTPDFVAFDGGAEAVAKFIQRRDTPGSYHDLCDSDSIINMVGYNDEAFHDGTGSNPHSLSISAATRADVWPLAPTKWRAGCIENMAIAAVRQAKYVYAKTGISVPARQITRAESEQKIPGFISHAKRDPRRRTDPGREFPWPQFLARYARLLNHPVPSAMTVPPEEDMTIWNIENADGTPGPYNFLHRGGQNFLAITPTTLVDLVGQGMKVYTVSNAFFQSALPQNGQGSLLKGLAYGT